MTYKKQTTFYIISCFVLAIMALMIATGIGRFVFTPILPIMLEEKTVQLSEVIWLSSANYLGYFVGSMSLFRNTRHVLFLIIGILSVTMATFFSSLHQFSSIFFFRFLAGAGGAWALISVTAWAVPWLKAQKIKRVGFIYAGVGAGIALSGIVCSILIKQDFSAISLWYAVALISLLLSISICVLLWGILRNTTDIQQPNHVAFEDVHNVEEAISEVKQTSMLKVHTDAEHHTYNDIAVWRLAVAYGMFGFGYIIPATFLPKIAKDMISGDAFLLVWPIFGCASVIGVILTQFFTHISDIKIWRFAQITLGLATLIPLFSKTVMGLLITALLVGGTFMLVIMSILKIAAHTNKSYNVVALVTASFAFGQLIGPLPALLISADDIWQFILPLSAFFSLLGVAFIWNMHLPKLAHH